jgi:hypothetical protein
MAALKLRSRSCSFVRDCDEPWPEPTIDVTNIEGNEELDRVVDMRIEGHSESRNNVVMSTSQFCEFNSAVMKEFEELKDRMRIENTKLSDNIKAVADEMALKIEVTNKNISESLLKQYREETESLKKEVSNKIRSEVLNLTDDINQLRKDTDLEVTSLRDNMNTVHEKLDDKMNEN